MNFKYLLYLFVTVIVIWAMDSINLNGFFKKNKIIQARVLYFLFALALIYLITNFLWDITNTIEIF